MTRYDDNGFWGPTGKLPDEPPIYGEERNAPIVPHPAPRKKEKEER